MYKYILFDLDNTLLDFNAGELNVLKKIFHSEGIEMNDENLSLYREINGDLWRKLESEEVVINDVLFGRFERFFNHFGISVNGEQKEQMFRKGINDAHDLIKDAKDILNYVKNKGYTIATASNGLYETQMKRMADSDILKYFDYHFISGQIGYNKPHAAFYQHCLNKLEAGNASEVLMIGDNIVSDIQGAHNAGIATCYFGEVDDVEADYSIRALEEIKNIV